MSTDGVQAKRLRLMNAVECERVNEVRELVGSGAIVDLDFVYEPWGDLTPLQLAVDTAADGGQQERREPNDHQIRLLLDLGASAAMRGFKGKTAADIADDYVWREAAAMLRAAAEADAPRLRRALVDAIQDGDVEEVRRLATCYEIDLDAVDQRSGKTPMQAAGTRGEAMVRTLLELGASPLGAETAG
jgi:hypothetical protein